jgi:cytochrome b561
MQNTRIEHYSLAARGFHWLTAALVLAAFLFSRGGPETRLFGAANRSGLMLHESLGVAVLVLTVARLLIRAFDTQPAPISMPGWMHALSRVTHWGLFALLVLVPLTAIAGSWLEGHALTLYGIGNIAGPFGSSAALGRTILGIHPWLGDAIIWIAGLHAAAALFHHFIFRDAVLRAMTH